MGVFVTGLLVVGGCLSGGVSECTHGGCAGGRWVSGYGDK